MFSIQSKLLLFACWVVNSHRHLKDNRFKFDVNQLSADDTLLDAQFWIYRDENLNTAARNETYVVSVHKEPGQKEKLTLLSSKQLTDHHWGWLAFNVTWALEEWAHSSHQQVQRPQHEGHQGNHGLAIRVSQLGSGELVSGVKKRHVSARARTGDLSRVRRAW